MPALVWRVDVICADSSDKAVLDAVYVAPFLMAMVASHQMKLCGCEHSGMLKTFYEVPEDKCRKSQRKKKNAEPSEGQSHACYKCFQNAPFYLSRRAGRTTAPSKRLMARSKGLFCSGNSSTSKIPPTKGFSSTLIGGGQWSLQSLLATADQKC